MVDLSTQIFHESWYRLANQKVSLRASVKIHRQYYRGIKWFVLHDPFSGQFYRIQQSAYDFISRLSPDKTIGVIWNELLRIDPDHAPGQGDIIQLMSQLHNANMLHYAQAEDSNRLFERQDKRKKQQVKSMLLNILYLKIPLFDPDPFLKTIQPLTRILFSKFTLALWLLLILYASKLAIDNFDEIIDGAQAAFAPSNLFMLYVTGIVIKIIHELGHSCAVRRFGGEVHTVGIMFMLLAPLPYMDATASWAFRSKWHRMLVGASGMFFEFAIAAIAVIVWANVGGGPIKATAYNALTIASVTTLLFNINPLMKFDGYYILSDWLDRPNLQQHSQQHLKYLTERYLFKKTDAFSPATGIKDSLLFTTYGISSTLYRFVLFSGIIIAISHHYLLLAAFMATLLLYSWLVAPLQRFTKYLFGNELGRVKNRAIITSFIILTGIICALTFIPIPVTFTAPGVIQATKNEFTINHTSGKIDSVQVNSGHWVNPGDTLLILINPEIDHQINETYSALDEARSSFQLALAESPENMEPILKRIWFFEGKLEQLLQTRDNLIVRAGISGIWVSPYFNDLKGKWINKGDSLGEIIDTTDFQFIAAIPQDEVSRLFSSTIKQEHLIKLKGNAFHNLFVDQIKAIPAEQSKLPSAALGWYGGGELETNNSTGDPQASAEPFYEVRAHIYSNPDSLDLIQGRSGKIRFKIGYSPLLPQLWRKLQQVLQKYYRI